MLASPEAGVTEDGRDAHLRRSSWESNADTPQWEPKRLHEATGSSQDSGSPSGDRAFGVTEEILTGEDGGDAGDGGSCGGGGGDDGGGGGGGDCLGGRGGGGGDGGGGDGHGGDGRDGEDSGGCTGGGGGR
eukprot:7448731-Karenia_brevis.AAC.1